jgi:hypothetical protein
MGHWRKSSVASHLLMNIELTDGRVQMGSKIDAVLPLVSRREKRLKSQDGCPGTFSLAAINSMLKYQFLRA